VRGNRKRYGRYGVFESGSAFSQFVDIGRFG